MWPLSGIIFTACFAGGECPALPLNDSASVLNSSSGDISRTSRNSSTTYRRVQQHRPQTHAKGRLLRLNVLRLRAEYGRRLLHPRLVQQRR